jgi:lipid II:glycine glycyltransferase (peptidoglycan interpeptide bridge formation enzyme)
LRNAWSPHPKLYTFGGPCATGIEAEKINEAMVKHSLNLMRKRRNVLIYWIWGFDDTEFKKAIERLGFSARRKRKTTFINLEPDEDSIFDSFKKKYRQNIRTGEKEGVTIIESNTQEDLAHFYDFFQKRLEEDIRKQPGMGFTQIANATIPRAYFSSLWENAFQNNMVRMFFAEHNGKRIGALINFYYKDMAFLGHTSILREHGDLQAYKILIWHTIKDAKKNGFKRLDLTGLPPSEAHGQYRFKKDWNGEVIETTEYKRRVK